MGILNEDTAWQRKIKAWSYASQISDLKYSSVKDFKYPHMATLLPSS